MDMYLIESKGTHWISFAGHQSLKLGSDQSQVDVNLEDNSISSVYALFELRDGDWWIEDLGSNEGIYLNSKELEHGHQNKLSEGMRISFGQREYVFTKREPLTLYSLAEIEQRLTSQIEETAVTGSITEAGQDAMLEEVIAQLNGLLDYRNQSKELHSRIGPLFRTLLKSDLEVISLEDQVFVSDGRVGDPYIELLLGRVRFQTQAMVFCSALHEDCKGFLGLYAPLLFDDLLRGYICILAPEGRLWQRDHLALFSALSSYIGNVLSNHIILRRAQEDREVLHLNLVGIAPQMQKLKIEVLHTAHRSHPVLVCGDQGVGKSRIARSIHQASKRRDAPLITIDAANFPKELFESEICGCEIHTSDGFVRSRTGKAILAHGGSLLIEEIGEVPLGVQPMLLTLIQNGICTPLGSDKVQRVEVRMMATSTEPVSELIRANKLLPELAETYKVLQVPSLRQRKEDIPQLFRSFLARFGEEEGLATCVVKDEALAHLQDHHWVSNIRELREIVARCFYALDPEQPVIEPSLMQKILKEHRDENGEQSSDILSMRVRELEVRLLQEALMAANDDIAVAAQDLGISRIVMYRKMRELGIG